MQITELTELLGVALFSGDTIMAGMILTACVTMMMVGMVSLVKPPPMAYMLVVFMGILMGMAMNWLNLYLGAVIIIVCVGAIAMNVGKMYAD